MTDGKKGIFDLDQLFNINSPFKQDWVNLDFKGSPDDPEIQSFNVIENRKYIGEMSSTLSRNLVMVKIPLIAKLSIKGSWSSVVISCSDGQSVTITGKAPTVMAEFTLSIEEYKLLGYKPAKYTFTATVMNLNGKETDQSTVTVNLSSFGQRLSVKPEVKIIIDPGHGYTKGNTGTTSPKYNHKVKGVDGKPEKNPDGSFKKESNDILKLPQYVIDDPNTWIIDTQRSSDHTERGLVFDIAVKLKEYLEKNEYKCFLTRSQKVIEGNDDSASRKKRVDLANFHKAQYFISIHADGSENYTSTGAHVIYPNTNDKKLEADCMQLANDVFRFYNVVQVERSPRKDPKGIQVLGTTNKSSKKVLVELGFLTNPRDAKALFSNIDKIAQQLSQGIIFNIESSS